MLSLLQAAEEIARFLEAREISYVLIGGLAVQYWGEPRSTRDVNVAVLVPPERLGSFLDESLATFRPRIPDARDFALKNRVLLLTAAAGIPVDLSLGIPGYEEEVMCRAVVASFPGIQTLRLISAADLIIHKCVAGRARDIEDTERILIRQKLAVDLAYIGSWLQEFAPLVDTHDVQGVFEQALRNAQVALEG